MYYQKYNLALLILFVAILGNSVLTGQEKTPEWVSSLPNNVWTKIDQGMSGNRVNASVYWLQDKNKLVLIGGNHAKSNRESKKPSKMIYDAGSKVWSELKEDTVLPAKNTIQLMDSTKNLKLKVNLPEGVSLDFADKVSINSPLSDVSSIFGFRLIGEVSFYDPVNNEILLIGGSAPSAQNGSIGNWRYSIEKNTWSEILIHDSAKQPLSDSILSLRDSQKNLTAKIRNEYYSFLAQTKETKSFVNEFKTTQEKIIKDLEVNIKELRESKFEVSSECVEKAVSKLSLALEKAKSGLNLNFAEDTFVLAIESSENASWLMDEAKDYLALSPTPRKSAMGIYDPHRNLFILHGGDHGDYMLTDTWHYDMKSKKWFRVFPEYSPSGRFNGQSFWLPETKTFALLGGNTYLNKMKYQHFDRGLEPDVWLYDPETKQWSMLVKPGPEIQEKSKDNAPWFMVKNPIVMTQYGVLICPASGGNHYHDFLTSSTWMLKLDMKSANFELTKKHGVVNGERIYRSSVVKEYDPKWYDAAEKIKTSDIDKLIATMPTNQWVKMPLADRPCPERSWGTSIYDPIRDQVYFWTGGHCADPADIVHHYHPGINAWSIPYVAAGVVTGNQFTGRPDCQNHTYKNYAFDPVTGKMVATHRAGTFVYDPDLRDWTGYTAEQPFLYNPYSNKNLTTPMGVVAWAGGCNDGAGNGIFFQIFDVKNLKWSALEVKEGSVPANVHGDEGGLTWDSKRNLIYINAASAYQKPNGKIHAYDPKTKVMKVLDPKNREVIGDKFHTYRETLYLPEVDLVLYGMGFLKNQQIAYEPQNNRWVVLNIAKQSVEAKFHKEKGEWSFGKQVSDNKVGSITFSPTLDLKRNVLWAPSDYKAMYVLKIDAKSLVLKDNVE